MKLSAMRELLAERGIKLTKSLGQNFLHDGNQLRRIVKAAELGKGDKVLEIGPGLGPLTELLLERAGEVLAIEKDRRLCEILQDQFATAKNLVLQHDDALIWLRREKRDWSDWKLVANLPYSVASPILVELAQAKGCPKRMVVTLQIEVARRLVARAGDDDYGVLSLLMQLHYEPRGHFRIPADCFFPAPDVDSACVTLVRREHPLLPPAQHAVFEKIVKRAFSQRRKMMLKLLKLDWAEDRLAVAFQRLGLSPEVRAERVALEQFVPLAEDLGDSGSMNQPQSSGEIFDVVNERDEVIGQEIRARVHQLGLKHRAVHVLVFNRRGELFLQKRSMKKDTFPGAWDSSASGHLNAGEDYDACALRELAEEIGLKPARAPRRMFKIKACAETGREFVWVYRCEAEGPFELNPEEVDAGEWLAPDGITKRMLERPQDFASALLLIWKRLTGPNQSQA